jgi:uncharacterized protein
VACAVGPALANWQGHLFDGQIANVPPAVVAQIEQWFVRICDTLADEQSIEFPFDEIDQLDVESNLGDWCIGFVDAIFVNEQTDWFDIDEEAVGMLTMPMMVFSGIEDDDPDLQAMRQNEDILEQMADEIPNNLTQLFLLFHAPAN